MIEKSFDLQLSPAGGRVMRSPLEREAHGRHTRPGSYPGEIRARAVTPHLVQPSFSRLGAALAAGGISILLNSGALALADCVPLATAHGGLLRLLVMMSGGVIHPPTGAFFQFEFHIAVGLLMVLFYAYLLEPWLAGPPWARGMSYAVVIWLINAAVVLPMLGEGFAGSRNLTLAGMLWFATAHTLFFVLAAVLYKRFTAPRQSGGGHRGSAHG